MSHVRSITAADFADDCPVPLDLLGRILRVDADDLPNLLNAISEVRRARFAVWLYGRNHTRALSVRVGATCSSAVLRQEAGALGVALHDLSRQPEAAPVHDATRSRTTRRVSLGGSRTVEHRPSA